MDNETLWSNFKKDTYYSSDLTWKEFQESMPTDTGTNLFQKWQSTYKQFKVYSLPKDPSYCEVYKYSSTGKPMYKVFGGTGLTYDKPYWCPENDNPTAGDLILQMRQDEISLGDPQAKEYLLNKFPSIRNEIEDQDKILDYEQNNNLIRVGTPSPTGSRPLNFAPVLVVGGILVALLMKK